MVATSVMLNSGDSLNIDGDMLCAFKNLYGANIADAHDAFAAWLNRKIYSRNGFTRDDAKELAYRIVYLSFQQFEERLKLVAPGLTPEMYVSDVEYHSKAV